MSTTNHETDEDVIDTEDLQAKIDLSMSFVHNLATSWVKPKARTNGIRTKDIEQELKEHMRHPPRLGVGAPVTTTQSTSREAARLKGQLMGKKRTRDDETSKHASESEEDSRTGAIKKKVKAGPFDIVHGKKKAAAINPSKIPSTSIHPPVKNRANANAASSSQSNKNGELKRGSLQIPNENAMEVNANDIGTGKPLSLELPDKIHPKLGSIQKDGEGKGKKVSLLSVLPLESQKSLPASVLKQPLLNLEGSPSEDESRSEIPGDNVSGSLKKKRKRRKKKKHASAEAPAG